MTELKGNYLSTYKKIKKRIKRFTVFNQFQKDALEELHVIISDMQKENINITTEIGNYKEYANLIIESLEKKKYPNLYKYLFSICFFIIIIFSGLIKIINANNLKQTLAKTQVYINSETAELSWTRISRADGYNIYIDDQLFISTTKNIVFLPIDDYGESHIIEVEAFSNNPKYISSKSTALLYKVKEKKLSEVPPFFYNSKGNVIANSEIDVFSNAFFKINFPLSGHYNVELQYEDTSQYISNFKLIDSVTKEEVYYQKNNNRIKVYLESEKSYLIELYDLDNNFKFVKGVFSASYETTVFDEFSLTLLPKNNEIIRITCDEAKDFLFKTKEFNPNIFLEVYSSLSGYYGNGLNTNLVFVDANTYKTNQANYFYLVIKYSGDEAIDIMIENINVDERAVILDETVTIDDDYSIKVFKFVNNDIRIEPLYIEFFDENLYWINFFNSKFHTHNDVSQIVNPQLDSTLFELRFLLFNETYYIVFEPFREGFKNGNSSFKISREKPEAWAWIKQ